MAGTEDLLNKGVIIRQGSSPVVGPERTFIVSGVGRGGTSMLSTLMLHAGIFMGDSLGEVVNEDQDFMAAFHLKQRQRLLDLIRQRNARHPVWGFKAPNVQAFLGHADIALFRNPHLILIFRDPLAIAQREIIAEHRNPAVALRDAADGLRNIIAFLHSTSCPALLLSYEKALLNPQRLIESLLPFCGIAPSDALRQRLLPHVQPNSETYANKARRRFTGLVEYFIDGVLLGWCHEIDSLAPVELDLFVGDSKVLTFKAADHRPDLARAGYGNGNHGFALYLGHLGLDPRLPVMVRVVARDYVVPGSGKPLGDYRKQ